MSDGGHSEKSAYSAARVAVDGPQKRPKIESTVPPAAKPPSKSDESSKKRVAGKGKAKS